MHDKDLLLFIQSLVMIGLVFLLSCERDRACSLQQEVNRLSQQIECRNECVGAVNER